jgi:hypothetical protein
MQELVATLGFRTQPVLIEQIVFLYLTKWRMNGSTIFTKDFAGIFLSQFREYGHSRRRREVLRLIDFLFV